MRWASSDLIHAIPNNSRPGTVLLQYPGTGSPIRKGDKATLTISASPGARNEVGRGAQWEPRAAASASPAYRMRPGHRCDGRRVAVRPRSYPDCSGTLRKCEKGGRCDVGGYTCSQSYFGGPTMSVRCGPGNPPMCQGRKPRCSGSGPGTTLNLAPPQSRTRPRAAVVSQGRVPLPKPLRPGEGVFDRCQPGAQGGSYDVWIKSTPCAQAPKWLLRLLPTFNLTERKGIGRKRKVGNA